MQNWKYIVWIWLLLPTLGAYAQKGGLPLAEEYFALGEYTKAVEIYRNFTTEPQTLASVYEHYATALIALKRYDEWEAVLKKASKSEPYNVYWKGEMLECMHMRGSEKEAERQKDKLISSLKKDPDQLVSLAEYWVKKVRWAWALRAYTQSREVQGNPVLHSLELALIYKVQKKLPEMSQELLRFMAFNSGDKEYIKGRFQEIISSEEDFVEFEKQVIAKIQENPGVFIYIDVLVWIYIQRRDFERAFMQSKSYDKLLRMQGAKVIEVGKLALENKEYRIATDIFEYVCREYMGSPHYILARKYKIQAKEELVKSTYPVDQSHIRSLIKDYDLMLHETGRNLQTFDAVRNMALLYGYYLGSIDTALALLQEVVKLPWVSPEFAAKCKLDMGDMYILREEYWEATLVYAQVEKSFKDQPLGHEAKLRGAKLDYYRGDFEFARDQLNVLKLATHREIANDAIDLSVFIQENTGDNEDSLHLGLRDYAHAELLVFQNKYPEALNYLDSIIKLQGRKQIEDDVAYLRAKVYKKTKQFEKAVATLESIAEKYKYDVYADDAAYMLGTMYEEELRQPIKAMEKYNQFLIDFPSSIYGTDVRKRYRALRGDTLN